jgi:hypothetical protein
MGGVVTSGYSAEWCSPCGTSSRCKYLPAHNSSFRLVKGLSHTAPISFPHNEHTHIYMANAM